MLYRQLGRSGLSVSTYALGTNAFGGRADEATSIAIIHHQEENLKSVDLEVPQEILDRVTELSAAFVAF
jgi:aryl-alcohol dehydrogenase-like predicted oxidoreductase